MCVKNSIGNGEAKELICMTHGHDLRGGGNAGGKGLPGGAGQWRKNWDNCNSIVNKIYFLKKKVTQKIQLPNLFSYLNALIIFCSLLKLSNTDG